MSREAQTITRRILSSDGLRRSPASVGGEGGHKEWSHFLVFAKKPDGSPLDILINFSLNDGTQTARKLGIEVPRVTFLVNNNGDWKGAIDRYDLSESCLEAGRIDQRMGPNSLIFKDGCYWIEAISDGLKIALKLTPLVSPVVTPSAPMDSGYVRWLILPQLIAEGFIDVGGQKIDVCSAKAYHDHNWGTFRWGENFSWQWMIAVDDDPDSSNFVVVSRVLDEAGHNLFSESVLMGNDSGFREFRGKDVSVSMHGLSMKAPEIRIPPVINLILNDRTTRVPERIDVQARRMNNSIDLAIETHESAQICLPADNNSLSISVLTEVISSVSATGEMDNKPFEFSGRAIWEETCNV